LGKPQFLLHGLEDESVPPSLSAHYAEAARAQGDPAVYVPFPGVAHMEVINARGPVFAELMTRLETAFGPARP
jgi:dipeptidyl aminopeptidase/acylaminoacyl peptidase